MHDTTTAKGAQDLVWEPPGPGTWEFDASHQQRPYPKVLLDWAPEAFSAGFRAGFAQLGIPLDTMAVRDVNGWMYMRPVPLGNDSGGSMPPKFVFTLLFKIVPSLRRRLATAKTVFDDRPWVAAADAWDTTGKRAAAQLQASLGAVDLDTCSDTELASLLDRVNEAAAEAFRVHFTHAPLAAAAIGRFLLRTEELSGTDVDEAFAMLAGYSASTSEPLGLIDRIVEAIPQGFSLDGDPKAVLGAIRQTPAAEPLANYLARFGDTIVNDESPLAATLRELPSVIVSSLRVRMNTHAIDPRSRADEQAREVRDTISGEHVAEWDQLLADARRVASLRDDDAGAALRLVGRSRHVVLEAGRRLTARGVIEHPESAFDVTATEIADLLTGRVSSTTADANREARLVSATATPPGLLGPPEDEPDFGLFPEPVANVTKAVFAYISRLDNKATADGLSGIGIGTQPATSRARIVLDVADVVRVEPGDVLVAPMTTPTYNAAIAASAALVCDHGGNASHAAIMAREFGVPAVVGTGSATAVIPDGAIVTVDPVANTVTIVEHPAPAGQS